MEMERPKLLKARHLFKKVYDDVGQSVSAVGTLIGGKVDYNINRLTPAQGQFRNACAIRMSYVLNNAGLKIPKMSGKTVSGKEGDWYLYKVKDLVSFMRKSFGEPDEIINIPTKSKLIPYKGIVVFEVDQWDDATGHATIWDGVSCSDKCYFTESKKAYIWNLTN